MKRLERYMSFPEPWNLDEEWLERLGMSQVHGRRYGHLSVGERRKLEADRLLIEEYAARELLRPGLLNMGLMNRMFDELDNIWLREGKGRAVDFRHALHVLDTYATYCRWADAVQRASNPLDVLLPYWIESVPGHEGPGILGIQVNLHDPSLGTLGDVRWERVTLRVTDFEVRKGMSQNEFAADPCAYTEFYPRVVGMQMSGEPESGRTFGLGHIIARYYSDEGNRAGLPTLKDWDLLWHDMTVTQKTCDALDIRKLLNAVGTLHFRHRVGKVFSPIRFEVSSDIMKIGVVGGPNLIDPRVAKSR